MEEDIKILEHFINNAGIEVKTFELKGAVKNLINKYKEQEKMIELMAEFYAKGNTIRGTKEQIIEEFKKKAKGE